MSGGGADEAWGLELIECLGLIGLEEVFWDTEVGAELEGELFLGTGLWGEGFIEVDGSGGVLGVFEGGVVGFGVAGVFPAVGVDGGDGTGAEAEVVVTAPVGEVVLAEAIGLGVVGDFVSGVSGVFEGLEGVLEEFGIGFGVLLEFAFLEAEKEVGIFFVGEAVGGDVFGIEAEGLLEGGVPLLEGLAGDSEDEVEVDVFESGFPKDGKGSEGLFGGVDPSEAFKEGGVPGLNTHADAVDAECAEGLGFFQGDGGGVHFEGPFLDFGEIEGLVEAFEEVGELFGAEGAGGAAAEEEGVGLKQFAVGVGFFEDGVEEVLGFVAIAGFFVEAAVGANFGAEGDVDIEVTDGEEVCWRVVLGEEG